jgi:hypothetical protein
MKRILRRPSPSMMVALAALVLAAGGVAYATIPDSSGVIHGCFSTKTGALRVIDTGANQSCTSREQPLSWNQQGPPGPPGPPGTGGATTYYDAVPTEECTSSRTYGDLATVGPSIQVNVPANALALLALQADINSDGEGDFGLFEPTDISPAAGPFGNAIATNGQFVTRPDGGTSWTVYHLSAGTRSLKMVFRLSPSNQGSFACFRNRKLWVTLVPVNGS